mgnify:CR=1 FL=1
MAANYLEAQQIVLHFAWTLLNDSALRCELYTLQTSELRHVIRNLWDKGDQLAEANESTEAENDACQDNAQIDEFVVALDICSTLVIHKTFPHDCVHQCHCDSCHGCCRSTALHKCASRHGGDQCDETSKQDARKRATA